MIVFGLMLPGWQTDLLTDLQHEILLHPIYSPDPSSTDEQFSKHLDISFKKKSWICI